MKKLIYLTVTVLTFIILCLVFTGCGENGGNGGNGGNGDIGGTVPGMATTDTSRTSAKTTVTTATTAATSTSASTKATVKTTVPTSVTSKTTAKTTNTTKITTKPTTATTATTVKPKNVTVFLDPGHGGYDPGVTRTVDGVEYRESEINLAVALLAKAELEKRGYTVVMSRETDKWVELESRPVLAQQAGADVFVSIHVDSFSDKSVYGTRIYYTHRTGLSYVARTFATYFMKEFNEIRDVKLTDNPDKLAYPNMKAPIIKSDKDLYGEGRYLAVLAAKEIPSVLIEMGFITNDNDLAMLKSPWWQRYAAQAIADGIDAAYADGVIGK